MAVGSFVPMMNQPKSAYDLINASVQVVGGFSNLTEFYNEAFVNLYGGVKWKNLFNIGSPSVEETWSQTSMKNYLPSMARYLAFDAEKPKLVTRGFSGSSGNMPRMGISTSYNEKSLNDGLKIINNYAGRPDLQGIYNSFVLSNTDLINSMHMRMNYSAFQIESTGKLVMTEIDNGGGVTDVEFDFRVPATNKRKAGGFGAKGKKLAWSDENAYPIGDLIDMDKYATDHFMVLDVFRIDKQTWQMLVDHPTTKRAVMVKATNGLIQQAYLGDYPVDDEAVQAYLTNTLKLPRVEIVDEIAAADVYDKETRKVIQKPVRSFKPGTVVLRKSGKIGTVQWSLPTLEFSTPGNPVFTVENGMFQIQNETWTKNRAREISAEFTGIPVLEISQNILYLDVTQAAS